jgi:hypothetical protein
MMVWAQRNHILAVLDKFFGTDASNVMRLDEHLTTKNLGASPSAYRARIATLTP